MIPPMSAPSAIPDTGTAPQCPARLLEDVFFAPLREVMDGSPAIRRCQVVGDEAFAGLGVLRVLQSSKSGRDFLQVHGIPNLPGLNRGNYFLHERKLDEHKAWCANDTGKRIQALAICIAHNLLKLFNAKLKGEEGIEDAKLVRAWNKDLAKRAAAAAAAGRSLPLKLYQALYRPTEVSLQFLRWLRCALSRPTCYSQALARLRPLMEAYI